TGRDKVIKFEGGYHGLHDAALVSVKPHPPGDDLGDIKNPKAVSGGAGVPKASLANIPIATFNDLETVERRFRENPNEIAAVILEPIMMNVGMCLPQRGFPLAAFGTHARVMKLIADHKVFHGGTYNTNPISMAAGLATFREVLTRDNYTHVEKLSNRLVDGYKKTIAKVGLQGYIASAGANGVLMLYPKEVRNYRDWLAIDIDLWRHYWFGMVNRGVMCQPYWWDEQWTISVQHTEADIDQHLAAFADVAPALAAAQHERLGAVAAH